MVPELKQVMNELKNIKKELRFIKEHMVDADTILTAEERRLLDKSIKNEKEGKLVSLDELKNARNNA